MRNEDMLAKLMAQAVAQGSDLVTMRAIVEESCEMGADRVLSRLGLEDDSAQDDLDELRDLLAAWRAAKASVTRTVIEWVLRGIMALMLIGIAMRLGVMDMLK